MNSKEKSLLEIAVALLQRKRKPQKINDIIKEVMSIKGIKPNEVEQYVPQFLLDFMKSGYFIYCGNDCWDLKERQPVSMLDKDGDYEDVYFGTEDVKENELADENVNLPSYKPTSDIDDPEDDNENDEENDDLSREFENPEEDNSEELTEVSIEDVESDEMEEEDLDEDEFKF